MAVRGFNETIVFAGEKYFKGARNYGSDVGFGLIAGHRRVAAFGHNPSISIGIPEDIWSGGGLYPWMSAATSLELVSTSASDAAAGVGARTVVITGLDANFNEVTQTVTLNGLTAVPIPTQLLRINSFVATSGGSTRVNVGDLIIRDAGAGTTRALMSAGYGTARQSQFTVPAGHSLQLLGFTVSITRPTSTRDATVATFAQDPTNNIYRLSLEVTVNGNPYVSDATTPGALLPEKTDFGLRCTSVSTNNTELTGVWQGLLKQNAVE